jgi:quinol monooxygenase YgiN
VADAPDDVQLVVVTLRFRAADPAALAAVLSKYVVVARGSAGCRNMDLCVSATDHTSFLVVQKWESPEAQRTHFDSPAMVEMAQACTGLLLDAPDIDLFDPISAHDLA